ncbi:MAG: dTMP kinase, partial [Nitrospiraceae bacterium]
MRSQQTGRIGIFITLEGVEGSGKTTQLIRLAKLLREEGYRVVETREPGGTPLAERIRELLLGSPSSVSLPIKRGHSAETEPMTPECETTLILAARSQHIAQVIRPALKESAIVLCDRFSDSTLAYQGYARGLSLKQLRGFNRFVTGGLTPDLTLLFDLPVEIGLGRRQRDGAEQNRLDREASHFHELVRKGFLDLAVRYPRRIKLIDARRHQDVVAEDVAAIVLKFL